MLHRMDSGLQGDFPSSLQYLLPIYSRLVHHLAEQQARGILFLPLRTPRVDRQANPFRHIQDSAVHVSCSATREEAKVITILPWWHRRGLFPLVLQLHVDLPVLLPECQKIPITISVRAVLSYQHLRHADLQHSAILSHTSALSSCTNKVDRVPVDCYPLAAWSEIAKSTSTVSRSFLEFGAGSPRTVSGLYLALSLSHGTFPFAKQVSVCPLGCRKGPSPYIEVLDKLLSQ